jgi:hypothetical protein
VAMMAADDETHDAMAAVLDARAGQDLSPADVVALWEMIAAAAPGLSASSSEDG